MSMLTQYSFILTGIDLIFDSSNDDILECCVQLLKPHGHLLKTGGKGLNTGYKNCKKSLKKYIKDIFH